MRTVLLGATFVTLIGCSTVAPLSEASSLDGTAWVLDTLAGHPALVGQPPTALFEAGRILGSDGCNRYTMPYVAKGSALQVGPRGASTQMACPGDVMKQADAFTVALGAARRFRLTDGRLQLLAADGAVLAAFSAQSRTLAGSSWRALGINNGKGAVASAVGGSVVTMVFSTDGRVSGSAGCNHFTAAYETAGSTLKISSPAATRKMCADSALMEQERAFLTALETVATTRFEGERLELRTVDGALALYLEREAKP